MILPLLASGDFWTWNVAVRYESPTEGLLVNDRERWTVRVGKASAVEAERLFLGSWVDRDTFVPAKAEPEVLKGRVEADGTLSLKGDWADPAASKALRRLLADRSLAGWPAARKATLREPRAAVPGGAFAADLRIDAVLEWPRLGGENVKPSPPPGRQIS